MLPLKLFIILYYGLPTLKIRFCILLIVLLALFAVPESGGHTYWQRHSNFTLSDDSIQDSIMVNAADTIDSLLQATGRKILADSLANDTAKTLQPTDTVVKGNPLATQWNDSIAAAEDSIKRAQKKALDHPVSYEAKDSIIFYLDSKNAFLYGDAKVNYTNIELLADSIVVNLDSSVVHAAGVRDTLGQLQGRPIFKQGNEQYESDKLDYNFETRKGFIENVYTEQQEGFLRGQESKRGDKGEVYLSKATYTTCDEPHPHFYIAMSRAKVYPGKSVYSGPAWLVVEDVPLPLAIPFAYFPFTDKYSSGFIMPSYGDENKRGFYLRDGGYYFAFNDYVDLKLTGEIFTKGSWGVAAQSTYRRRYKYSGNFYFNYQVTKTGEKNMPDYSEIKNFKVQWTHRQDAKANPNSTFSASINFATQSYEQNNLTSLYNPTSYSQSTRTSSLSYSRTFPKIGLSISSSFNISQNMKDSTLALTMPDVSISLAQFYPFKKKKMAGKERWYEKISVRYTGNISNSISTKEDKILKSDLVKDWRNGMKHTIPVSATFNLLKYINVTPMFNYTERWYTKKIMQNFDPQKYQVIYDTIYGFNRVYNYNLSLSANTKLYGFYKPNKKIFGDKIQMVRHVLTPSISYSYAPDFGASRYGYWDTYTKTDANGNVSLVSYSPYQGALYGVPGKGKSGSISMDLSNNVEMKYKDRNDSIRKMSIIDELGASLSYNMSAKTQPWSNLSTRIRLKFGKSFTFNMNAVFATYAYEFDRNGNVVVGNRTEWSYGRFGRFQGTSKNLSYTFNNGTWKKWVEAFNRLMGRGDDLEAKNNKNSTDEDDEDEEDMDLETNEEKTAGNGKDMGKKSSTNGLDEDGYMEFAIPWSFSISYGITMAEDRSARINVKTMRYPYKFTQNLNFSGNIKLSNNWNINFSSGWDFNRKDISMTTFSLTRDMHCFNISAGLVFGTYQSYNITLRAKASTLTDALKYDKKSSYSGNIQWY